MNIPNRLSLMRIILVPVMLVCFLVNFPYHLFVTLGIFIVASLTDFLDGYIARKYNMVTEIGIFLDSIADKILTTTALMLIAVFNLIPQPYGVLCLFLFVSRDLIVNALRQIASTRGIVVSADKLGKYKAFMLDIAIPVIFLFSALNEMGANATLTTVFMWIGYGFMIIASVLNIISCVHYLVKNRIVFKEKIDTNDTKASEK